MLSLLSIVTVTFNNIEDLFGTYEGLSEFRRKGGTHIIINGGDSVRQLLHEDCILIEEPDNGIYDAINKGIEIATTKYLMLIHSGDYLSVNTSVLEQQLKFLEKFQLDLLLNDCTIQFSRRKRLISSKIWKPWMFKLGVQPPHPPIIYRINFIKLFNYNIKHSVIADFDYLERIFSNHPKFAKGNEILVNMISGGKTSSGLPSFLLVNKEFIKLKGYYVAFWFTITRPLVKVLQMF